jgi:hypothetical protein
MTRLSFCAIWKDLEHEQSYALWSQTWRHGLWLSPVNQAKGLALQELGWTPRQWIWT